MRTIIAIGFVIMAQPQGFWQWVFAGAYILVAIIMDVWSTPEAINNVRGD